MEREQRGFSSAQDLFQLGVARHTDTKISVMKKNFIILIVP